MKTNSLRASLTYCKVFFLFYTYVEWFHYVRILQVSFLWLILCSDNNILTSQKTCPVCSSIFAYTSHLYICYKSVASTWWKPFFLVFQQFRQEKLSPVRGVKYKWLNINDSVRLLKMANLSCILIPVEVFQGSEAYLGPCGTSEMKRFCENC